MAVFCPSCDGIINIRGCQACGWKVGDPHARNLDVNPFRPGRQYGEYREPDAPPVAVQPEPVGSWVKGLPDGLYRLLEGRLELLTAFGAESKPQGEVIAAKAAAPDPDNLEHRYMKLYPCGCQAGPGPANMPDYCPDHGSRENTAGCQTVKFENQRQDEAPEPNKSAVDEAIKKVENESK